MEPSVCLCCGSGRYQNREGGEVTKVHKQVVARNIVPGKEPHLRVSPELKAKEATPARRHFSSLPAKMRDANLLMSELIIIANFAL